MNRALVALLLVSAACSSSSRGTPDGAAAPAFVCPQTIAQLRASPPAAAHPDYEATFAVASAACDASLHETFESCDGPYDRMTWSSFPFCGGVTFYDHSSGELIAALQEAWSTGDVCGALQCVAGPAQFFAPGAPCTTVATCGN